MLHPRPPIRIHPPLHPSKPAQLKPLGTAIPLLDHPQPASNPLIPQQLGPRHPLFMPLRFVFLGIDHLVDLVLRELGLQPVAVAHDELDWR